MRTAADIHTLASTATTANHSKTYQHSLSLGLQEARAKQDSWVSTQALIVALRRCPASMPYTPPCLMVSLQLKLPSKEYWYLPSCTSYPGSEVAATAIGAPLMNGTFKVVEPERGRRLSCSCQLCLGLLPNNQPSGMQSQALPCPLLEGAGVPANNTPYQHD